MKRVVIIHCWGGYPDYCWYPQTRKELEKKGFEVLIPQMPDTHHPKLSLWLPQLRRLIKNPKEDLYLIGHSVGCITILRYLEQLKIGEKIGGVILVAGFTEKLGSGYEEIDNFFDKELNFKKIKTKSNFFAAINSDNDQHVPLKFSGILKNKLGAKLIIKHHMGHFSGHLDNEESVTSLPELTTEILRMSS